MMSVYARTDPWAIECDGGYENPSRRGSCHIQVCDATMNRTCENGGTCLQNNTCSCPIGYQGEFCERESSICNQSDIAMLNLHKVTLTYCVTVLVYRCVCVRGDTL